MIMLDGTPIKDFGLVPLENHSNPINTGIQHKTKKIPGKAGVHPTGTELSSKNFYFDFAIKEKNEAIAQVKLNEFAVFLLNDLGHPRDVKLIFDYEPDKHYTVKLSSLIDPRRIRGFGRFSVSFVANDPHKYASSSKIINLESAGYNGGTSPATGTITVEITEATNNLQVTLQNTGEFIYVSHNFDVGDTILIDLEKEMIYKNGYSIMQDVFLESDFFKIPVGEFEISASSGNATLEFTERWI